MPHLARELEWRGVGFLDGPVLHAGEGAVCVDVAAEEERLAVGADLTVVEHQLVSLAL